MKKKLSEVGWMQAFRPYDGAHLFTKNALKKGNKIGAYNPFGQLFFFEEDTEVIVPLDEETRHKLPTIQLN